MKFRLMAAMSTALGVGLAVFSAFSLSPGSVHATMYSMNVVLDEPAALATCNPNPAPSGGGGSGTVTYDSGSNMLTWNIMFSNLSGAATAAHFHGPATPAQTAGIQVTISDLTSPSMGSFTITEAQEADLLNDLWYINYHTSACPGGEIRDQVNVPAVGGQTELIGTSSTALKLLPVSEDRHRLPGGLTGMAAAITLLCAGGALFAGRRVRAK
jgi:hypothetical protein